MSTFTAETTMIAVECAECHCLFGITEFMEKELRRSHTTFYCPVGHNNYWSRKSDLDKKNDQIASLKKEREFLEADVAGARKQLKTTEVRRRAEKAAKTKLKKRIAMGVCPCCSRTFQNLARHMASKHPEEVAK